MNKSFTNGTLIFSGLDIRKRSDRIINYFLPAYFVLGLVFATFYGTWIIAIGVGGLSVFAYYFAKFALRGSNLYQYVLSVVLAIFMAQFIYQLHGMFEMHFFAFIGSALLVTYQKWKLQIPLLLFVILHHAILSHLQNSGVTNVYFTQLDGFDVQTFVIHILLTMTIFFISALFAFQLDKYQRNQVMQTRQMIALQAEAQRNIVRLKNKEAMEEKSTILESIGDGFFAVDKNWMVTYWNNMAEKVLGKTKEEMMSNNLWTIFANALDTQFHEKYHKATRTGQPVHFEEYFTPLNKWFEVSAYPTDKGLTVYFKDVTERKQHIAALEESEKRYSDIFHLTPLPMWIVDVDTLRFVDVNDASVQQYGYTREEFLSMNLRDIYPDSELPAMEDRLELARKKQEMIPQLFTIHKKKSGVPMNMELQITPFQYKAMKTSIVIALDITERLRYVKAIEEQNEKLVAISWMQSHVVRAPLAKIMGLVPLIKDEHATEPEQTRMLNYLSCAAEELDDVIKNIVDRTSIVSVA